MMYIPTGESFNTLALRPVTCLLAGVLAAPLL